MNRKVPVAIFTYNRPKHTGRLLASIERNARGEEIDIWIFSDAPKQASHAPAVEETRALVRRWAAGIGATVRERDRNLGIARSIVGATSELVEEYGRIVVLEDDLVVAPDFLRFMLEGLRRYEDAPRVMQISGHLLTDVAASPTCGFFLPLSTSWGWATWARAWRHFRWGTEIRAEDLKADPWFCRRFNADGACPFFEKLLLDCLARPADVWDIFWWYAVANANGLALYPKRSLVWNGGFDGTGVHCGRSPLNNTTVPPAFYRNRLPSDLTWPASIYLDAKTFEMNKRALALMFGTASLSTRILARLSAISKPSHPNRWR
jgi:hypothetical protein